MLSTPDGGRLKDLQKMIVSLFTNKEDNIENVFLLQDDDNLQFSIIHSITLMSMRRRY